MKRLVEKVPFWSYSSSLDIKAFRWETRSGGLYLWVERSYAEKTVKLQEHEYVPMIRGNKPNQQVVDGKHNTLAKASLYTLYIHCNKHCILCNSWLRGLKE